MIVLGIDTSAVTCTAALYSDRPLSSFSIKNGTTHSQTLLPGIREIMEKAGVLPEEIDLIAISSGPGSFTGLRIGISTVKGLAIQRDIPCAAVSTLEALALNAREYDSYLVCPLMDARRGEYYNALFHINGGRVERLIPDRAIPGDLVVRELDGEEKIIFLGDGAEKFVREHPEFASHLAPEDIRFQSGESVCLAGIKKSKQGQLISCQALSPTYLRLPQAEREWLEKNK